MNIIYIVFTAIKIQITFMVCIAHIANAVRSRDSYGGIGSIHIDFAVTEGLHPRRERVCRYRQDYHSFPGLSAR